EVIFAIDQVASKSDKSILGRYGNTTILTVLIAKELTKNINSFFPLTIAVEEKFYAVGRIPAGFNKREGKSSYDAVIIARLIDRSLRSFFPLGAHQEVQIINHILSVDPASTVISSEFAGELVVSATKEKIVMLEVEAPETTEEALISAVAAAHQEIRYLIGFFEYIANSLRVKKIKPEITEPKQASTQQNPSQKEEEIIEELQKITDTNLKKLMSEMQVSQQRRLDGRNFDTIRPLKIHLDYLSAVHGSALFARGNTEVLAVTTVGKTSEKQVVDNIFSRSYKHFIHHYNFPNFAVNELAGYRNVSRREIGHGELVEKTFTYLVPPLTSFPYTVRVVSEVLASDGSSSQAAICATSLALMTTGVPLIRPAAGIALGLFA
ncbi:174_t:CDS:2, partial [Racocetra persica]